MISSDNATVAERIALALKRHGVDIIFAQSLPSAIILAAETIGVDLGSGGAVSTVWTCDLSAEYVRINADYRT